MAISSDLAAPLPVDGDAARVENAIALAAQMLREAEDHPVGRLDRRRRARLAAIVGDPDAQAFTVAMTDDVVRITERRRAWRRFADLVERIPHDGLSRTDRVLLSAAAAVGRFAPRPVMHWSSTGSDRSAPAWCSRPATRSSQLMLRRAVLRAGGRS